VVKYRKIPPAAAANQIAENARIPPAANLQTLVFSGRRTRYPAKSLLTISTLYFLR
jgi:hypothetical protein